MEIFKEMDQTNRDEVLKILNGWWENEDIPEETFETRVVFIYEKNDTS